MHKCRHIDPSLNAHFSTEHMIISNAHSETSEMTRQRERYLQRAIWISFSHWGRSFSFCFYAIMHVAVQVDLNDHLLDLTFADEHEKCETNVPVRFTLFPTTATIADRYCRQRRRLLIMGTVDWFHWCVDSFKFQWRCASLCCCSQMSSREVWFVEDVLWQFYLCIYICFSLNWCDWI